MPPASECCLRRFCFDPHFPIKCAITTESSTLALFPATLLPVATGAESLPAQPISAEVLAEKYAKGDDLTLDDVRRRVARALAAVEP